MNINKLIIFQGGAIIAALVFLELIARLLFFLFGLSSGDLIHNQSKKYIYAPYVGIFHSPFTEVRSKLRTDRHGFIHNGNESRNLLEKDNKEFRVFILGGSTVAGTFVSSNKSTLASLLELEINRIFEASGVQRVARVINAGVGSYTSSNSFSLFKWYILPLKPDYIIAFDGTNDSMKYLPGSGQIVELLRHDLAPYHLNIFQFYEKSFTLAGSLAQPLKMMGQYSAFISLIHKIITRSDRLKTILGIVEDDFEEKMEEMEKTLPIIVEQYKRNILSTVALSKQFNLGVAYFMQPTLFSDTPNLTADENKLLNTHYPSWHGQDYFKYKKKYWDQASRMVKNLGKDVKEEGVLVKDLSKLFTEKNKSPNVDIFGDHVHYTDRGRQIIASEIIKNIKSSLIKSTLKNSN